MPRPDNQRRRLFQSAAVAQVFAAYPPKLRTRLLALRRMIFEVARQTEGVGNLHVSSNEATRVSFGAHG